MQPKPSMKLVAANALGSLGYLSLLIEWAWVALVFVYPLAENGQLSWILGSTPPELPPPPAPIVITPFTIAIIVITVAICLVTTIYALVKFPISVGRTGARLTHESVRAVIPQITGHKKISRSRFRRLSFRLILGLKAIFVILPIILTAFLQSASALPRDITWIILAFLVFWPLLYFGLQTLLTSLLKLDPTLVW